MLICAGHEVMVMHHMMHCMMHAGFITSSGLTAFIIAAFVYAQPAKGDCPIAGCIPTRSFTTLASYFEGTPPTPSWNAKDVQPSGAGCVANGGRVLCPLANSSLVSWDASGGSTWTAKFDKGQVVLPLVDESGGVIATDGYTLAGYNSDGTRRGDPIHLYPVQGDVYDLTITSNNIVVILYKCGFLATYLTDGIPHAGLWLNDTINGTEGTFLPLSAPAVKGNRLYLVTIFKPQRALYTHPDTLLRLYAIDAHTTITSRLEVAWEYDLVMENTYTPAPNNYHNPEGVLLPLSSILVQNNTVVMAVNVVRYHSDWTTAPVPALLNGSTLLSVTDQGGSAYTVNYVQNLDSLAHTHLVVQTLNYCQVWPGQPTPRGSFLCQDEAFFICLSQPPTFKGNCFVYNTTSWPDVNPSLVPPVLKDPGVTGQTMAIQVTSTPYTQYGFVQGLEYRLYAFNVTSELLVFEVLWTLHLPALPTGQLVTVDGDGVTLLVVTTKTDVAAYVIGSA